MSIGIRMSTSPAIIVPARLASTRFPRKLLHPVRGKPLILWTAERIHAEAPEFPLWFAVDDAALAECLEGAGFRVVRTRTDHTSGTDRLAEANREIRAPVVINVQGDEPLVSGRQIRALAEGLEEGAEVATLANRFSRPADFHNPNQVKVVRAASGDALYFSRSPIPYPRDAGGQADADFLERNGCFRHLGLYAYRAEFLDLFTELSPGVLEGVEKLEQLRALEHGYRIRVALTDEGTVGIDAPEDVAAFEARLPLDKT